MQLRILFLVSSLFNLHLGFCHLSTMNTFGPFHKIAVLNRHFPTRNSMYGLKILSGYSEQANPSATTFRNIRQFNHNYCRMSSKSDENFQNEALQTKNDWKINMLYDSECILCLKEVNFMKKRDVDGSIKFTDLADLNYDPSKNGDIDYETGMKSIRAVYPDGSVISGVAVFRETYKLIGLGWLYAITNLPVLGPIFDKIYDFWAAKRLAITGRPDLAEVLMERAKKIKELEAKVCEDESKCKI